MAAHWVQHVTWGLLVVVVSASAALSPVDAKLVEAESIRSTNQARFGELLAELDSVSDITAMQRDRLRILHAYRKAIRGQSNAAISDLREVLNVTSDPDVTFRAGTLLANTYAITRQFQESLKVLEDMLPLQGRVKDKDLLDNGLLAAGVVYNQVGAYSLGEDYGNKVLAGKPNGRNRCAAKNLLLESSLGLDKKLSETQFQDAVQECEVQSEPIFANISRTYLIRDLHGSGKKKEAIAMLQRFLPQVHKLAYPRLTGEYESILAEYHMEQGGVSAAEQHAKEAIAVSAAMANTQPLVMAYKTLYEVADRRGNTELAFTRYRQYAEADKAYLDDVRARQLAYQIVRQDILQKTQQIDLLNQQNQMLQMQQRIDKQSAQSSRLLVLLLLLVVGFVGYWAYKIKKVQLSLRRWAETDALTGVCNRHHFTLQSEKSLAKCARDGEEVALIMFDLDHFKSINDRFNHGTGDWVLCAVTEACKTFCRRIDHFGRLGGEEFAILLYGCDARSGVRVAEDVRARLAAIDSRPSGHAFVITGSFGVTSSSLSGYDLVRLMSHADQALYRSKREGRNRVSLYDGNARTAESTPASQAQEVAVHGNVVSITGDSHLRG